MRVHGQWRGGCARGLALLIVAAGSASGQTLGGQFLGGQFLGGQSMGVPVLGGQNYSGQSPAPVSSGGRGYDPCVPQPMGGGVFGMLTAAVTQGQRDRACVAKRQAQWTEYNARQKAAKDQADAAAAQSKAKQAADAQATVNAGLVKSATAARVTRQRQAGAVHARHDEAEAKAMQRQFEHQAAMDKRARAILLIRAESAPGNVCRQPKLARGVMQGWNGVATFKDTGVSVIDIEHVTTVFFHPADQSIACHGVFVTNRGWKIAGTATVKRNVAGDPMFVWTRDPSQDLSIYDTPAPDPSSPEMASQTSVGIPAPTLTQTIAITPVAQQ